MCEKIDNSEMPDSKSILKVLELGWQDFFHARTQTWETLKIEAALVVGLIGADFKFDNVWVALLFGGLIVLATFSGILITLHHREGQITQYRHISNAEKALHLSPNIIDGIKLPESIHWIDIINPKAHNTPLFILRMHIAIMLFALIYVGAKLVLKFGLDTIIFVLVLFILGKLL